MKPMGAAALAQLADLHPASAFAPSAPQARRPRPSPWHRILTWRRVALERRRLLELDDRILKDIGLSREDASREASRPFWEGGNLR